MLQNDRWKPREILFYVLGKKYVYIYDSPNVSSLWTTFSSDLHLIEHVKLQIGEL